MEQIELVEPTRAWSSLTVILVDDAGITRIQQATFGKTEPTDVVSLRYDPVPPETQEGDGEVVVNVQRAHDVGHRAGPSRELGLYLAHGCNHLTGASDHTPALRAAMRRKETAWLKEADRLGLLNGLMDETESARPT